MIKEYEDRFSSYNPVTNFAFFIGVILLGMFINHPVFVLCSLICSFIYFFTIKKTKGFKFLLGMIGLLIVVGIINALFNTLGDTVLFTIFGRPYTYEALFCGLSTGCMLITIFAWFACYNAVMSSDKFIYLFGKITPSVSMVLSMILRLVPSYRKKIRQIAGARRCIGLSGEGQEKKERLRNSMTEASVLMTWALEGGIVTADSMRSRGFGSGKRTNYAIYKFDARNWILCILMLILFAAVIFCMIKSGIETVFYPTLSFTPLSNIYVLVGMIAYVILMLIPSFLNIKEAVTWRILRSEI